MAEVGDEIRGIGSTIRFVETNETSGGERVVIEITYEGGPDLPPAHFHPNQTERFEVLEGQIHAVIGGEERSFAAGDHFEVPPGTVHQMWSEHGARQRWETSPPLRTERFFELVWGIQNAVAEGGEPLELDLAELRDEFRLP
jgi:quercetin dioxygenase-like cupin family protein